MTDIGISGIIKKLFRWRTCTLAREYLLDLSHWQLHGNKFVRNDFGPAFKVRLDEFGILDLFLVACCLLIKNLL